MDLRAIFSQYAARPLGVSHYYAVLIPIVTIDGERVVLFESRAYGISQGGDTSFPGGRVEANESFAQAAVRECCEELGVRAEQINLLGEMDYLVSGNRIIACFVGEIAIDSLNDLSINQDEVAYAFAVSLSHLMNQEPESYSIYSESHMDENFPYHRIPGGEDYPFHHRSQRDILFYDVGDHLLWGMTAKLTQRFIDIIRESSV